MCVCGYVDLYVCVCVCVYIYICVCGCVYICMCVCACVCMRRFFASASRSPSDFFHDWRPQHVHGRDSCFPLWREQRVYATTYHNVACTLHRVTQEPCLPYAERCPHRSANSNASFHSVRRGTYFLDAHAINSHQSISLCGPE